MKNRERQQDHSTGRQSSRPLGYKIGCSRADDAADSTAYLMTVCQAFSSFFHRDSAQFFFFYFLAAPGGRGGVALPPPVSGWGCGARTSYMASGKFYGYSALFWVAGSEVIF